MLSRRALTLALLLVSLCLICKSVAQSPNCAFASGNGWKWLQLDTKSGLFKVFCDQEINDGGWTVVLQRQKGNVNFHQRAWREYKLGFNIDVANGEDFFIGLDALHALTTNRAHELLFIMSDFAGVTRTALYDHFVIADETRGYEILEAGEYYGDAGDGFFYNGSKFAAPERPYPYTNTTGWNGSRYPPAASGNRDCRIFAPYPNENSTENADVLCWMQGYFGDCIPQKSMKMLIRPTNLYVPPEVTCNCRQ